MKTIIAMILVASTVASADVTVGDKPMVFRAAANEYAVLGEGTIRTVDCTVTADGMRAVIEVDERHKAFITFIDRHGEPEAQCQLATLPARPVIARRRVRTGTRVASK